MSSTRIPSFLLGGINLTYNFLGKRTGRTAAYGLLETGVKLSPLLMVFVAAGMHTEGDASARPQAACTDVAPERRSTLTQ